MCTHRLLHFCFCNCLFSDSLCTFIAFSSFTLPARLPPVQTSTSEMAASTGRDVAAFDHHKTVVSRKDYFSARVIEEITPDKLRDAANNSTSNRSHLMLQAIQHFVRVLTTTFGISTRICFF